jgi:sugar lactone lactonase YvrE
LIILFIYSNTSKGEESFLYKRTQADIRVWIKALEMYYVDFGNYPPEQSIVEVGNLLRFLGYWKNPVIKDAWGNFYIYSNNSGILQIRSLGQDGIISSDDIILEASFKGRESFSLQRITDQKIQERNSNKLGSYILNAGTTITLAKSGSDIIISWNQDPSQSYDIARATDKRFYNAVTLAVDLVSNSYTYKNGLVNNRSIEFFDVTDNTETNRGSENNGGDLPPKPPDITVYPSGLYIGSSASLQGTGFSSVKDDNQVWFSGGVKANIVNATENQIDFIVPPGAVSGNYYVSIRGAISSEPINTSVYLDAPNELWTVVRTIGWSEIAGDYWVAGNYGGNKFMEMSFDTIQGKWLKNDRTGTDSNFLNAILYCSTKTDRFGRIFCGRGTISSDAAMTAVADTTAGGSLSLCRILAAGGNSQQVIGAAADPNPDGIPERDVVYFAYRDISNSKNYIMKVPSDCGPIMDSDYGNTSGVIFNFPAIVGMSVDRDGNLYISEGSKITRIRTDETIELVKGGFNSLLGIDVKQGAVGGTVFIMGAEYGTGKIKAIATDNLSASPKVIAAVSYARAVAWSKSVFDEWTAAKRIRSACVYNSGNTVIEIRGDYRLIVEPERIDEGMAYISSPEPGDAPANQIIIRQSDPNAVGYSTILVRAWWWDGVARVLCAYSGDPRTSAPYEPAPADSSNCDKPRDSVAVICDNKEDFSANGAGSFVVANGGYNLLFSIRMWER